MAVLIFLGGSKFNGIIRDGLVRGNHGNCVIIIKYGHSIWERADDEVITCFINMLRVNSGASATATDDPC